MANKRSNKGSGFLAALLVIIDLGLLVWIGMSWYAQREAEPTDESPDTSYAKPTDSGDSVSYAYEPDAEPADDSAGSLDDWILGTPGGQTSQPESPPQDGASRFGSVGRPQTSDSQTWYEQIIAGSIPSDVRLLTDFREVTGEWKGLICYSTEDYPGAFTNELVNFKVSGTSSEASLLVDWYLILWPGDGEWLNEEEMEDTVYTGSFANGSLQVNGAGNIRMTAFYEREGVQYARGEMDVPDGSTAVIGMIRP